MRSFQIQYICLVDPVKDIFFVKTTAQFNKDQNMCQEFRHHFIFCMCCLPSGHWGSWFSTIRKKAILQNFSSKIFFLYIRNIPVSTHALKGGELFPILHPLSHRSNTASLLIHYSNKDSVCSTKFHSLVLPAQTFKARSHHDMFIVENHTHSLWVPLIMNNFHPNSFFRRLLLWGMDSR